MAKKRKKAKTASKVDIDKLLKETGYGRKSWFNKNVAIVLGVAIVAVIAVIFAMQYTPKEAGRAAFMPQEKSFMEAANACEPAVIQKKIGTATLRFEIKEGCILQKEVIAMDETEPQEIRDLFVGSSMECDYEEGSFDSAYVEQISGNLGTCQGTLVDAILAVI